MHLACYGKYIEVIQLLKQKDLDLHTPKDRVIKTTCWYITVVVIVYYLKNA